MTEVTETAGHATATAGPAVAVRATRRNPHRGWRLATVAVVLVALTGLASQHPGSGPRRVTSSPTSVTYSDRGNLFRITYPRGWRREAAADGGVVLRAGGQNAVGIKEFALASRVDPHNLQDMRAVTDAILSSPTAHLTVLTSQVVHIGGLTGLYYLYSFPIGAQQGVHAHYFLFSGSRMFTIVCQAVPAAAFPGLATTFDAVTQSFAMITRH